MNNFTSLLNFNHLIQLNKLGKLSRFPPSLSPAYIEENLSQKGTPVAIGIFQACLVLGPALGFLIGGFLLNIWVDGSGWSEFCIHFININFLSKRRLRYGAVTVIAKIM